MRVSRVELICAEELVPTYGTSGSAGFDIKSNEDVVIKAGERVLVSTGLKMDIPEGLELQIRPRSGLAYKYGVTILNAPGTIDSDYRDEIKVLLFNSSDVDYEVKRLDRIAQGVLATVTKAQFVKATEFLDTGRTGGFGSTGR